MDVLAINGSPRGDRGVTAHVLAPFLEGMRDGGARTSLLRTCELDIGPCLGCRKCWTETNGACVQKDDMQSVYTKLKAADVLVLATPVFFDCMTGPMKGLLDRCVALVDPRIEVRGGRQRHPLRNPREKGSRRQVAILSVCGFHEMATFAPLVTHVKAMARNMDREYAGAVLRPHGWVLAEMRDAREGVYGAAREAGRQLARDGRMSPATLRAVGRPLLTRRQLMDANNEWAMQGD